MLSHKFGQLNIVYSTVGVEIYCKTAILFSTLFEDNDGEGK